jgi:F420-0:gamma-glutamyl ligase-like protein
MSNTTSTITVNGKQFNRVHIKTHFINVNEEFDPVIDKYVKKNLEQGDLLSISEKIVALSQGDVVYRDELPIGFWAKFLSKFASRNNTGIGVAEPIKMQYAIRERGLPLVIGASIIHAVYRLFGYRGKFYEIIGQDVSGLDGFYDHIWSEYGDMGIENPKNPKLKCNHILEKYGVSTMIVDANDLGCEILGKSSDIKLSDKELKQYIIDNPAGQEKELTPFIIIRNAQIS